MITLWRHGYCFKEVKRKLEEEDVCITSCSLQRLVKKFQTHHIIKDLPRRKRPKKLSEEMIALLDDMLKDDDEMTARRIWCKLTEKFGDFQVSLSNMKRVHRAKGWVCTRLHYCQLIREVNKLKRNEWCRHQIDNNEEFRNVVFTDEYTVQLGFVSERKGNQEC